jgi:hypothetical protein
MADHFAVENREARLMQAAAGLFQSTNGNAAHGRVT